MEEEEVIVYTICEVMYGMFGRGSHRDLSSVVLGEVMMISMQARS